MPLTPHQHIATWVITGLLGLLALALIYLTVRLSRREEEIASRRLWNWAHPIQTVAIRVIVTIGFSLGGGLFAVLGSSFGTAAWTMFGVLTVGAACTLYMWVIVRGPIEFEALDDQVEEHGIQGDRVKE